MNRIDIARVITALIIVAASITMLWFAVTWIVSRPFSEETYYNNACKAAQEGTAKPGQLRSLYERHWTETTFAELNGDDLEPSRHWLRECIELGRVPDSIREVH